MPICGIKLIFRKPAALEQLRKVAAVSYEVAGPLPLVAHFQKQNNLGIRSVRCAEGPNPAGQGPGREVEKAGPMPSIYPINTLFKLDVAGCGRFLEPRLRV
jgi:hypothetical protein